MSCIHSHKDVNIVRNNSVESCSTKKVGVHKILHDYRFHKFHYYYSLHTFEQINSHFIYLKNESHNLYFNEGKKK